MRNGQIVVITLINVAVALALSGCGSSANRVMLEPTPATPPVAGAIRKDHCRIIVSRKPQLVAAAANMRVQASGSSSFDLSIGESCMFEIPIWKGPIRIRAVYGWRASAEIENPVQGVYFFEARFVGPFSKRLELQAVPGEKARRLLAGKFRPEVWGEFQNYEPKVTEEELYLQAAKDGDMVRIQSALNAGMPVDTKTDDRWGKTALILAAEEGQVETVKALISHGANVEARGKDGKTALTCVISNDAMDERDLILVVLALVEAGADVKQSLSYVDYTYSMSVNNTPPKEMFMLPERVRQILLSAESVRKIRVQPVRD